MEIIKRGVEGGEVGVEVKVAVIEGVKVGTYESVKVGDTVGVGVLVEL